MESSRTVTVTITWAAFRDTPAAHKGRNPEATTTITLTTDLDDQALCEAIFEATNLYAGSIWEQLEPVLPDDRTHTALSVILDCGDYITIDGRTYEVAPVGFTEREKG
jgi:hypothetical protein